MNDTKCFNSGNTDCEIGIFPGYHQKDYLETGNDMEHWEYLFMSYYMDHRVDVDCPSHDAFARAIIYWMCGSKVCCQEYMET